MLILLNLQFNSSLNDLDMMSTYGHRVTGNLKLHESTQMFLLVDYVWEMTVKKACKYGEYGLLEHLLFLSFGTSCFSCEKAKHTCLSVTSQERVWL